MVTQRVVSQGPIFYFIHKLRMIIDYWFVILIPLTQLPDSIRNSTKYCLVDTENAIVQCHFVTSAFKY